jgi:hypothetical protein
MAQDRTVNPASLLVLALAIATSAPGASLSKIYADRGDMIVRPLDSAPFPHPDRASGHTYQGQLYSAAEHYSDSTVAIFIPRGFRSQGSVDFVVHFHGWRNHVEKVLSKYGLVDQLIASGRNAVLIVPQGPYEAPDSFGGKLEDIDGFKRFIEEICATLQRECGPEFRHVQPGRIILSGHSGGYHVISAIVDHGGLSDHVKEVWLFDALYGQTEKFLAWSDREQGRMLNIFTDHGGTSQETEALMKTLKSRGSDFLLIDESQKHALDLKRHRLVFLHTGLEHDEVLQSHRTFQEFLQAGCLLPIRRTGVASPKAANQ